jgi:hypothetical protein
MSPRFPSRGLFVAELPCSFPSGFKDERAASNHPGGIKFGPNAKLTKHQQDEARQRRAAGGTLTEDSEELQRLASDHWSIGGRDINAMRHGKL